VLWEEICFVILTKITAFIELAESFDAKVSVEVVACALNNRTFQETWIHPETGIFWQLAE